MYKLLIPLILLCLPGTAAAGEQASAEAIQFVLDAVAAAPDLEGQFTVLAEMAWPSAAGDPAIAAFAREELVRRGAEGMPAMGRALPGARPDQQAEIAESLTRAFARLDSGFPPDYIPGLETALWFGGRGAREIAIPELARFRAQNALLPIIDAAIEDPELQPLALESLGRMGDDRARFWLEEVMLGNDPELREHAALALARIGGRARLPLKAAMRGDRQSLRETAARALLQVAGVDDLNALHGYVYAYPDDDPDLINAVRERAIDLERTLTDDAVFDSSSPTDD